jgi:endo-beta-N-acetylglucosaminidase D
MAPTEASVTVTYRRSGIQPPVFVVGSFSDPAWQVQEMEYTTDKDGECVFFKDISGIPGSGFQYKFRIGLGDWWVLDEEVPTVADGSGNWNNSSQFPLVKG